MNESVPEGDFVVMERRELRIRPSDPIIDDDLGVVLLADDDLQVHVGPAVGGTSHRTHQDDALDPIVGPEEGADAVHRCLSALR